MGVQIIPRASNSVTTYEKSHPAYIKGSSLGSRSSYHDVRSSRIFTSRALYKFPDEDAARAWFEEIRWGGHRSCPKRRSTNTANIRTRNRSPTDTANTRDTSRSRRTPSPYEPVIGMKGVCPNRTDPELQGSLTHSHTRDYVSHDHHGIPGDCVSRRTSETFVK